METIKEKKTVVSMLKPKDGALGIILVGGSDEEMRHEPLGQRFVVVQDKDDRGSGTGLPKRGLPGGGIEKKKNGKMEIPLEALIRELSEEIAEQFIQSSFTSRGCFQKRRINGFVNNNYLFSTRIDYEPSLRTNDPKEVSQVFISPLWEIINFMRAGVFHEGSIRLIFHFLNGVRSGSLNKMASFHWLTF